jgi:hypothetical protein
MADSIDITIVDNDTINTQIERWFSFPLMKELHNGNKNPIIVHFDITLDTSGAAAAETTDPANLLLNFTTPQQVYIRSSNALDVSKNVDVIGQKADGSFGQFTLTTNAVDGTTAVDVGTWNFIMQPRKNDAFAGNCIIDDDGASGTVFWTMALGATATTGIIVVPKGYNGDILESGSNLLADTGADNEGMLLQILDLKSTLNRNLVKDSFEKSTVVAESTQVSLLNNYLTAAVTGTYIHIMMVIWEE